MEKESMQKIVGDLLKSGKYVLVRDGWEQLKPESVSYTHLTLPTNREV